MNRLVRNEHGFTLIELIIVIVVMGILAGVAVQSGGQLFETARIEETKQEMDGLARAIAGNSDLTNSGVRLDFGYVGDVGALPPNIDALYANPGSYSTWNGPYVSNRFDQIAADYKTDAWGDSYSLSDVSVISTGSGGNIVRKVANSADDLLVNTVSGNVYDADGIPPGSANASGLTVRINHPNGTGGSVMRSAAVGPGGYFSFDSVPVGNHNVEIDYAPTTDTIRHFASVTPGSRTYATYRFAGSLWSGPGGGSGSLIKVSGSDSLMADCHGFYFWIENSTGAAVDISSLTITYPGLTGYYRYITWDGTTVRDEVNPATGSGEVGTFTGTQTIADGTSLKIEIDTFRTIPTGGPFVDCDNQTFTVTLSDGSSFDVTTGVCP